MSTISGRDESNDRPIDGGRRGEAQSLFFALGRQLLRRLGAGSTVLLTVEGTVFPGKVVGGFSGTGGLYWTGARRFQS